MTVGGTVTPVALTGAVPVTTPSTQPAVVSLPATDANGNTLTYTAEVDAYSLVSDLEQQYDFQAPPGTNYFYNAHGAQEKYLVSGNGSNPSGGNYYVLLPNGNLYTWAGSLPASEAGTPVAALGAGVYAEPNVLLQAPVPRDPTAFTTEQTLDLQAPPGANYFYNARGAHEKYLVSGDGYNPAGSGYYILLPNGNLYKWVPNSLSTSLAGPVVAALGTYVYAHPDVLIDAGPAYNSTAYSTQQSLDLQAPPGGNYFFNARGSRRNIWSAAMARTQQEPATMSSCPTATFTPGSTIR